MNGDATAPPVTMPSRTIARRALVLPVADHPDDVIRWWWVGSGSEPGKRYAVVHDDNGWQCNCIGGQAGHDCSHAWAARAHADPAIRAALRKAAGERRRMGREAAERLMDSFCAAELHAALTADTDTDSAYAKRDALAERIIDAMTGGEDND